MNWIILSDEQQLNNLKELSGKKAQLIFKHSTRCASSSMAKARLERNTQPENIDFYFLDLIRYRKLSNQIADIFAVSHESPQVLLIKDGECVYEESHSGIQMEEIMEQV